MVCILENTVRELTDIAPSTCGVYHVISYAERAFPSKLTLTRICALQVGFQRASYAIPAVSVLIRDGDVHRTRVLDPQIIFPGLHAI
jgi:hypothetical protein